MALNVDELLRTMAEAAVQSLGETTPEIEDVLSNGLRQVADDVVNIEAMLLTGEITDEQAKLQFRMQHRAAKNVLLTAEGLSTLAIEQAINAALGAIAAPVNAAIGFKLL